METITLINSLPAAQKKQIRRSKKEFIIIRRDKTYILTNDLYRYRNVYQIGTGKFAVISCIKNDIKL
jgi:hypothetical protein